MPELLAGVGAASMQAGCVSSRIGDETKLQWNETIIRVGEEILKRALRN
ncbi:MAG TPA: hypothetical protein VEN78_39695 [Bradyrhizobium sp.]|nr:hypothetical protein [Bradyrhizobium sp.]